MEQYPTHGGFGDDAYTYMKEEGGEDVFDFTSEAPLPADISVMSAPDLTAGLSTSFKDVFGASVSKGGDLDLLVDGDVNLLAVKG